MIARAGNLRMVASDIEVLIITRIGQSRSTDHIGVPKKWDTTQ